MACTPWHGLHALAWQYRKVATGGHDASAVFTPIPSQRPQSPSSRFLLELAAPDSLTTKTRLSVFAEIGWADCAFQNVGEHLGPEDRATVAAKQSAESLIHGVTGRDCR